MYCSLRSIAAVLLVLIALPVSGTGQHGALVLHGKGESPEQLAELVDTLRRENVAVAAPEMPWSRRRLYDRSAPEADAEVDAAVAGLLAHDASRVYLIGTGLGASYAVRYASRPGVTGIVALAPDHAPESPRYVNIFANDVRRARELISAGRPQSVFEFLDLLWNNLRTRMTTNPRTFLSYFDSEGPMNMTRNVQALRKDVFVLWIVPTGGDPGARQYALDLYKQIPFNPASQLVDLQVDYSKALYASVRTIVEWMNNTVQYIHE
jgi:pimeloyl-ACP methyl ester carboxylesterase